jgi:hypothetical protein
MLFSGRRSLRNALNVAATILWPVPFSVFQYARLDCPDEFLAEGTALPHGQAATSPACLEHLQRLILPLRE